MKKLVLLAVMAMGLNAGCLEGLETLNKMQAVVVEDIDNGNLKIAKEAAETSVKAVTIWLNECKYDAPDYAVESVIQMGMMDAMIVDKLEAKGY